MKNLMILSLLTLLIFLTGVSLKEDAKEVKISKKDTASQVIKERIPPVIVKKGSPKKIVKKRAEQPLALKERGKRIDKKTKLLREVVRKMTDAMMEENLNMDEIEELEEKYTKLGKEIKKDLIDYQKLTSREMNKLDPYSNPAVKEWKRMQGERK